MPQPELSSSTVRALLADLSPPATVRRIMETGNGHDSEAWTRLGAEGLLGIHLPRIWGGSGRPWTEVAMVLEETGAVLLCAPFLSTVALGATVIATSGDDQACRTLLPGVVAGETLLAVAVAEDSMGWDEAAVATRATEDGAAWRLDGQKTHVVDGTVADFLLVAARAPEGVGIFVVEGPAQGLTRRPLATVDQTRRQADLDLTSVPARRLAGATLSTLVDVAALALACESLGGARRCLEMAVDHARNRVQFGRPIGSFQAVAHRCAEMLVDLECARAAVDHAARAATLAGDSSADLSTAAPLAKVAAGEAFARAAASNIQVHGGKGFTWDCDAHLYFKRARSSQLLFGDPRQHRELLAQRLGW